MLPTWIGRPENSFLADAEVFDDTVYAYSHDALCPNHFTCLSHLAGYIGWPDTGALMRRLDDGSSSIDKKSGNMYQWQHVPVSTCTSIWVRPRMSAKRIYLCLEGGSVAGHSSAGTRSARWTFGNQSQILTAMLLPTFPVMVSELAECFDIKRTKLT